MYEMGALDTILVLGVLGGGAAYVTNFQGFKDWVNDKLGITGGTGGGGTGNGGGDTGGGGGGTGSGDIGGGGGSSGSGCTEFVTNVSKATTAQKVGVGAIMVGALMGLYRGTGVTDAKLKDTVTKMTVNDKTALLGVVNYIVANCSNTQAWYSKLRTLTITLAKKYGVKLKTIPTTPVTSQGALGIATYFTQLYVR